MKKYKYKSLISNDLIYDMDLDKLGAEGWELVSFVVIDHHCKYIYLFKQEYE